MVASAFAASWAGFARGFSARSSTTQGISESTQIPTDHQ
jgi:hypothetical protein